MEAKYRLRDTEDFDHVHHSGQSFRHHLAILTFLPNNLGHSRFGFSVSKKVGKATARNRAKRLLREAVRLRYKKVSPGLDVVFIARPAVVEASFLEVEKAVEKLLSQSQLIVPQQP